MAIIRAFEHDGSHFEIFRELEGGYWLFRILCDGNIIGQIGRVSEDVAQDAASNGIDIGSVIADELERAARVVHDLQLKRYR